MRGSPPPPLPATRPRSHCDKAEMAARQGPHRGTTRPRSQHDKAEIAMPSRPHRIYISPEARRHRGAGPLRPSGAHLLATPAHRRTYGAKNAILRGDGFDKTSDCKPSSRGPSFSSAGCPPPPRPASPRRIGRGDICRLSPAAAKEGRGLPRGASASHRHPTPPRPEHRPAHAAGAFRP